MEAEARARRFIGTRHPKVRKILFKRTNREGDAWLMEGKLWFRRALFFTARRSFRLQIS